MNSFLEVTYCIAHRPLLHALSRSQTTRTAEYLDEFVVATQSRLNLKTLHAGVHYPIFAYLVSLFSDSISIDID